MKPCCGNCIYWTDTRPTPKGKLPYFGTCAKGRPLKQGKMFKRDGHYFRYCSFTIRSDRRREWEGEKD